MSLPEIEFRIVDVGQERREVHRLGVIKIGRVASSHIRLEDPDASRLHAVLEVTTDLIQVIDLGSHAGTFVNGKRVNKAMLWDRDVLGIGGARVELHFAAPAIAPYEPADATERGLLDRIRQRPDDLQAREVYADWLEEAGRTEHAAYLRAELDPQSTTFRELREAVRVDPAASGWRAVVSRVRIDGCPVAACPGRWEALDAATIDDVRRCGTCHADVHYCVSPIDAAYRGRTRAPIAIDPAVSRDSALREHERAR